MLSPSAAPCWLPKRLGGRDLKKSFCPGAAIIDLEYFFSPSRWQFLGLFAAGPLIGIFGMEPEVTIIGADYFADSSMGTVRHVNVDVIEQWRIAWGLEIHEHRC